MRYRNSIPTSGAIERGLFLGFVQVHILYHAKHEGIFGLDMIEELARHGYRLSAGTLYPMLHKMHSQGLLKMRRRTVEGKVRKYYRITQRGDTVLRRGRDRARELLAEILPD